jgi:hypothetical protein
MRTILNSTMRTIADYSNEPNAPSVVPISRNKLTIANALGGFGPEADRHDYVSFRIEAGWRLDSLVLKRFDSTDDQGFIALQSGAAFTAVPDFPTGTLPGALGFTHFGPGAVEEGAVVGADLLPALAGSPALGPGEYSLWIQQLTDPTDYLLQGQVVNTRLATNQRDSLTGTSQNDTFRFPGLASSLLAAYDSITDFQPGDRIKVVGKNYGVTLKSSAGSIEKLSRKQINSDALGVSLAANAARAFTVAGVDGTFVALNDARAGFQAATDLLLHLEGYGVAAASPIRIV